MKTQDEITEFVRGLAERNKERLIANDFNLQVAWHDGEDKLRLVLMPKVVPGESRAPLMWALSLLSAVQREIGAITMVHDSYQAKSVEGKEGLVKHDGTEWGPGEMQYAVENNTVDADLVTEAFVFNIIDGSSGVITMANLPYRRTEDDVIFDWDALHVLPEGGDKGAVYGGNFPDALRAGLAETGKAAGAMTATMEALGLSQEIADLHLIAIGVKMVMKEVQWNCLVPAYSEEDRDLLKHSFTEGPLSEGIHALNEEEVEEIVQLEDAFDLPDAVK